VDDDFIAMVRVLGFYHLMCSKTVLLKTRPFILGKQNPVCCVLRAFATLQNFGVNFETDVAPEGPFAHSNHWHGDFLFNT